MYIVSLFFENAPAKTVAISLRIPNVFIFHFQYSGCLLNFWAIVSGIVLWALVLAMDNLQSKSRNLKNIFPNET